MREIPPPHTPDTRWRPVVTANPIRVLVAQGDDPAGGRYWHPWWMPLWRQMWYAITLRDWTYASIVGLRDRVRLCEEWCRRANESEARAEAAVAPYHRPLPENPQLSATPRFTRRGM